MVEKRAPEMLETFPLGKRMHPHPNLLSGRQQSGAKLR